MATKEELQALLERVEKATGTDRYADCHLWVLAQGGDARIRVCDSSMQDFVWERGIDGMWIREVRTFRQTPKYTASIDAALALVKRVLPSWAWSIGHDGNDELFASLWDGVEQYSGYATTPPLALIAALLEVLIAQEAVDA